MAASTSSKSATSSMSQPVGIGMGKENYNANSHELKRPSDERNLGLADTLGIRSVLESGPHSNSRSPTMAPTSHGSDTHIVMLNRCRLPPAWVPDAQAPSCHCCGMEFTLLRRRHHCRACGKVFCGKCSQHRESLPYYGYIKEVRVCESCCKYHRLEGRGRNQSVVKLHS